MAGGHGGGARMHKLCFATTTTVNDKKAKRNHPHSETRNIAHEDADEDVEDADAAVYYRMDRIFVRQIYVFTFLN